MPDTFSLVTPTDIVFGRGQIAQLSDRVTRLGKRVLIVHGRHPDRLARVFESLNAVDIVQTMSVHKEPDLQTLNAAIRQGKALGVDLSWIQRRYWLRCCPARLS